VSLPSERSRREADAPWGRPETVEWIGEAPPSQGLALYLDLLRSRIWILAVTLVVAVSTAALFIATADKVYRARADMLITPIPADNPNLVGLGLVSESGDPTRDAETLAQLITTPAVAARARASLRLTDPPQSLLRHVSAEPVAQSSIVAVTAEAGTGEDAARIANHVAEAAVVERTARLHVLLDQVIPRLRTQFAGLAGSQTAAREALSARLEELETLRLLDDPTIRLVTRAEPPAQASEPRPVLTIVAAFLGALIIGVGGVLAAHVLDTRVEREEDLRRYRIAVLGRIPNEKRRTRFGRIPLRPDELSAGTLDAYRRLASSLSARTERGRRTLFITGAGPATAKTTSAINLAAALAGLDEHVILVDGDGRRPSVGRTLRIAARAGVNAVIAGQRSLRESLLHSDGMPPRVSVLVGDGEGASAPAAMSGEAAEMLIRDSKALAEWLIVDGAALNYAPDWLPFAKRAEIVLLVVRLRHTRARDLAELAELLSQQGIVPEGFILVGGRQRALAYY
jgi:capsular polysaccharide biosynthesis protein